MDTTKEFAPHKWFHCSCFTASHSMRLHYFSDDASYLYADLILPPGMPWYRRLWYAVRYIFKKEDVFDGSAEIVMTPETVQEMHDFTKKYLEAAKVSS